MKGPALLLMGLLTWPSSGAVPSERDAQIFRVVSRAVVVPVTVTRRGRPVVGLQAADFTLLDNGVPQKVLSARSESVPIDLTLVLDTSGSTERSIGLLRSATEGIRALLEPADQFRLLSFDSTVREVVPLGPAGASTTPDLLSLKSGNASAVHDAILVALLYPVEPHRRHLVVVLTDAHDTMSTTAPEAIADIVSRSNAVVYLGLVRSQASASHRHPWMPFGDADPGPLRDVAESSGGFVRNLGGWGQALVGEIGKDLIQFRQSYVLEFIPSDKTAGWHALGVSVTGVRNGDITAKKGYVSLPPAR